MNSIAHPANKKRKYVGVESDGAPSLKVLEGDILRLLWDAGEPQSSVQVYQSMMLHRRDEKRDMQSPSTIAVTLSRMVEKGLLQIERRPNGGKGYYGPTRSRADVMTDVLDDVTRRLTGHGIGFLLTAILSSPNPTPINDDWRELIRRAIDQRTLKTSEAFQEQMESALTSQYPAALMEKYHLLADKKLRRTITAIEKMELADVRNEIATIDARLKKEDIWESQSLKLRQELAQIRTEVEALPDATALSK